MELPVEDWIKEATKNPELVVRQLFVKIETKKIENDRLKETLKFYAAECEGYEEGYISNALIRDNGQRARAALNKREAPMRKCAQCRHYDGAALPKRDACCHPQVALYIFGNLDPKDNFGCILWEACK